MAAAPPPPDMAAPGTAPHTAPHTARGDTPVPGLPGHAAPDALPVPPADGPGLFGGAAPALPQAGTPAAPAPGTAPPPGPATPATPYRVLARKYRPASFDDVIGQEAVVRILRRAFQLGRVAHAFMLTGVRGTGKTTTARILARGLTCIGADGTGGPTADPCGVCANCVAILADRHPDVVEMDAASRTGVDDMREIIESTRFRPMQARAKVFIVDEVHMLSRNAFNALLKTLEEPPPHVTFVFATTELRKVPLTVLSRCQRFDLRRVKVVELAAHFGRIAAAEGVAVTQGALEAVARAADGSVRDGLSLLDQAIAQGAQGRAQGRTQGRAQERAAAGGAEGAGAAGDGGAITAEAVAEMLGLADRALVFDLMEAVMAGRAAEALALTGRAHELGADLGLVLGDLLELSHTLTRLRTVPGLRDSSELPELERTRGAALADRLSIPSLGRAWQMLLKGMAEVEAAPDRSAAAEMVLIRLCHVAELPSPAELVRRLAGGPGASGPAGPGGGPDARAAQDLGARPSAAAPGTSDASGADGVTARRDGIDAADPAGEAHDLARTAAPSPADAAGQPGPGAAPDAAATGAVPAPWPAPGRDGPGAAARPPQLPPARGAPSGGAVRAGGSLALAPASDAHDPAAVAAVLAPAHAAPTLAAPTLAAPTLAASSHAARLLARPGRGAAGLAQPRADEADPVPSGLAGHGVTQPHPVAPASPGPGRTGPDLAGPDAGAEPVGPAGSDAVPPAPGSFRDVAALVAGAGQPMLHAHLLHSVHLVRFAPPVIELRPEPKAPRDLAPRLAALLTEATGTRWTIALSAAPGEPTLAEQGSAAAAARTRSAGEHPLVRAILEAFPGARLGPVRDSTADAYGLGPETAALADGLGLPGPAPAGPLAGEPMPEYGDPDAPGYGPDEDPPEQPDDMPEFAPLDAAYADAMMEDDR